MKDSMSKADALIWFFLLFTPIPLSTIGIAIVAWKWGYGVVGVLGIFVLTTSLFVLAFYLSSKYRLKSQAARIVAAFRNGSN